MATATAASTFVDDLQSGIGSIEGEPERVLELRLEGIDPGHDPGQALEQPLVAAAEYLLQDFQCHWLLHTRQGISEAGHNTAYSVIILD